MRNMTSLNVYSYDNFSNLKIKNRKNREKCEMTVADPGGAKGAMPPPAL